MDKELSEQDKQELYRTARFTNRYKDIWVSVGKCVFCDLNEKYVFYEENGIVMTVSLYAYIDGHFMILPRRHVKSPKELTESEWDTIRKFTYIAKKLIFKVHKVKGMQIVQKDGLTAQSTVNDHLHFHALPFDAPDFSVWNYRELKYTPLQNVALYKHARKQIIDSSLKFDQKYKQSEGLPIVCDIFLVNKNNEVLFEERTTEAKIIPDFITPPGGRVDNYDVPMEQELAREVKEETGIDIPFKKVKLLDSRYGQTKHIVRSAQLNAKYVQADKFIQNTYVLDGLDPDIKLAPGDDAKNLIWIPLTEAVNHPRISPEIKETLRLYKDGSKV